MKNYRIYIDEVGTGSIITGMVVCGVYADENCPELKQMRDFKRLNDSKKLTPKQRETVAAELVSLKSKGVIEFFLIESSAEEIDTKGFQPTLLRCYSSVIDCFNDKVCPVILDGSIKTGNQRVETIVGADGLIPGVMAASCLAKVYRDQCILELDKEFPEYDWKSNKGYLSPKHKEAINKYGLTIHHRKSVKINDLPRKS